MATSNLTAERLRELLDYDPATGLFAWKVTQRRVHAGMRAGFDRDGYISIYIDGKRYLAHRLAFLHVDGVWPDMHIDHMDGMGTNNRWVNLRLATRAINSQNKRKGYGKSGLLGVTWQNGYFVARIGVEGEARYLGNFKDAEEAHQVYLAEKRRLHAGCTI